MSELIGTTIGKKYRIDSELGRGGMAVVYTAMDINLERTVALKMIKPEIFARDDFAKSMRRFNLEVKALAGLAHTNIVRVLDFGDFDGSPYLVMEYIPGGSLRSRMNGPILFADSAALLSPVARALNYAHKNGIVHRDVKPENILINASNQALISDFGILKRFDVDETQELTAKGKFVGTMWYVAPEQIRDQDVDGRADIYSLGIVFYELITGMKPYRATTQFKLLMQHLEDPIPKAKQIIRDLPIEVDQIITKALAKEPKDRYENMEAFASALDNLKSDLNGSVVKLSSPDNGYSPISKKREKNNQRVPFLSVFLLGVIALAIGAYVITKNVFVPSPTKTVVPSAAIEATSTNTPTPTISPSPTRTKVTPAATATFAFTATPDAVVQPQNVSRLVQINSRNNISVVDMEWLENESMLVNAGSNKISFIDSLTLDDKQVVLLSGEIPLSAAFAPSTGKFFVLYNGYVKVIDTRTFKVDKSIPLLTGGVNSLAVSPDGKLLGLGVMNHKTQLIDTETGGVLQNLKSNFGGWAVVFSPDSKYVVSGTTIGALMWDVASGTWLPLNGGNNELIRSLAYSHDGSVIAGGGDGVIFLWNPESGELVHQLEGNFGLVKKIDFSPSDLVLVAGTDSGSILAWDVQRGSLLKELKGHSGNITSVRFSPDGKNIVSGDSEGSIFVWGMP